MIQIIQCTQDIDFTLTVTFHLPKPKQKRYAIVPNAYKKLRYESGRLSKPAAQSDDNQQAGGFDSAAPTTYVVWTPSVVSSSATTLSVVPPTVSTFVELDALEADSTDLI